MSVCEFGCVPIAHSRTVIAMNSSLVPHTFSHFECHPSNSARTCCNFSHCMTLENCSLILFFFCLFPTHLLSFLFSMSFIFFSLWACAVIIHVSVCRHPLTKSCGIWGRKVDMCGMGCSDALPTDFMTRLWTYGMSCLLSGLCLA